MILSKSLYVAGLQCHKLLWWKVHEPDAVELQPDKVLQDRFDQGAQVGTLARAEFPGGILIDHDSAESRLAATQRAIASSAPALFEGTFQVQDRVYPERSEGTNPERSEGSSTSIRIHADVLLPDGDGWKLIEVKSASSQKPEHIPDAAVQAWVLTQNGINLTGVEIMHLNKDFRSPGEGALLTRTDVTPAVTELLAAIPDEIEKQLTMLDGPLPELAIGIHCDEPRECPFQKRCWPQSRDHISKLHSIGPKRAASYMSAGVHWIKDYQEKSGTKAPSNQALTIRRQIKSMTEDRLIVEPGLAKALEPFTGRLGFLDFETISRAVPVWPGMAPWEQAAAQFSYHEAQADGSYTHTAFLAEGPEDARQLLAQRMVEATANADRVVMYTSFEKTQIRSLSRGAQATRDGLQQTVPALRAELEALEHKLIDLHPVIRDHVYHPAFEGSFSLKFVLPALVPGVTYNDLVIVNGLVASVEIARLLFVVGKIPAEERERVRQDLLDYCERDTWAMVRLLERLHSFA